MVVHDLPDGMPVLSRGKHRNPRRGACFMEMASLMAGEPWSDRPTCTHPLLTCVAQMVNDNTSDAGRGRLAPHIPSVIGVRGGGLAWEVSFTAAVVAEALPSVPEVFERPLAVGLLYCEELAARLGPGQVENLDEIRRAIADVPHAAAWARAFAEGAAVREKQFRTRSAPHLISCAVRGMGVSAAPDIDERLYRLLTTAIDVARRLRPAPAEPARPVAEPQGSPVTGGGCRGGGADRRAPSGLRAASVLRRR